MMNIKKLKLPMIILAIGLVLAIASCLLTGIMKEPVIREHTFEYSVTYRLDGEVKTFNGAFQCRFNGIYGIENATSREYVGEYTNDGAAVGDSAFVLAQKNGYELELIVYLDPYYLMGDVDKLALDAGNEDPYLWAYDSEGIGVEGSDVFDAEILSWEYPEPLENSFTFVGFSSLHSGSMLAMIFVAVLTIIACIIFVKKDEGVSYKALDKLSVVLNFLIGFGVIPFVALLVFLFALTLETESLMYQIYLCIPAATAFTIAASVALRRKGFTKSGLLVQLVFPVLFFAEIFVESLMYNLSF